MKLNVPKTDRKWVLIERTDPKAVKLRDVHDVSVLGRGDSTPPPYSGE